MLGLIDDIEEYNKRFLEETKNYKKFCGGKECRYADECERDGKIMFCEINTEEKILYYNYTLGMHNNSTLSFKYMCRRDRFLKGRMNMKTLNKLWENVKENFPEILPNSIDVWVEKLKENGMFEEE